MDHVCGRVARVTFNNEDFYILNMDVVSSSDRSLVGAITVRGNFPGLIQIRSGVPLRVRGEFSTHAKYGRQLAVKAWDPWAQSNFDVQMFLACCVEGFVDIAERFSRLGPEVYKTLTKDAKLLQETPPEGLGQEEVERAIYYWNRMLAVRNLSELLKAGGLGARDVQLAVARFGMDAPSVIRANPYRLMEIIGFSFPKVDELAQYLGVGSEDPRRVQGIVLWAFQTSLNDGHLYLSRAEAARAGQDQAQQNKLDTPSPKAFQLAVNDLITQKALTFDADVGCYLPSSYLYERESAAMLAALLKPKPLVFDPRPFMDQYERVNRITFSDNQRQAVERLVQHPVLVLTGLPGTGKTTCVKSLVRVFEESRINFLLMAPTGIAAKRMSAVTGQSASTIHRALRYDGTSWGHHKDNRLIVDAVIVDETSMVDQELLYRLLSALQPGTRLVLVGDDAQLPSVGAGNVLKELLACPDVPHVRLTQIFRQSEQGEIVLNSHRIHRGESPEIVDPKQPTEFKFVRISDEQRIVEMVVEMASRLKEKNGNFQVLSPKYAGAVGVTNLNEVLRERLNPPGPPEWKKGYLHFRLGDRLMVTQNDYKRSVYNGDAGKLIRINPSSLTIKIHGVGAGLDMEVDFPFDVAEAKLRLAYAITVHKSQGSEYDTVILPIVRNQGRMLQRNLLYTAVTRAKKQVWLLGEETAMLRAVENNIVVHRNTALGKAVSQSLAQLQQPPAPAIIPVTTESQS